MLHHLLSSIQHIFQSIARHNKPIQNRKNRKIQWELQRWLQNTNRPRLWHSEPNIQSTEHKRVFTTTIYNKHEAIKPTTTTETAFTIQPLEHKYNRYQWWDIPISIDRLGSIIVLVYSGYQ